MNLKNTILILLTVAFVTLFPHSGITSFPFFYIIPILIAVWSCLKYFNESFKDIGFNFKSFRLKSILVGGLVGVLFFAFSQLILFPVLDILFDFNDVDVDLYNDLKGNTTFYIFILIMGWLVGGLYEEIVFHGFIFSYLEKLIPGKFSTHLSFLITSILFGLYHVQLGGADATNAFIIGVGYLTIILVFNRNLWYGICCHGVYNSLAITGLYLGYL